jgi:hypothetical protein
MKEQFPLQGWDWFTSSALQRDADWLYRKMQDWLGGPFAYSSVGCSELSTGRNMWFSRKSLTCYSPSCKHWSKSTMQELGTPNMVFIIKGWWPSLLICKETPFLPMVSQKQNGHWSLTELCWSLHFVSYLLCHLGQVTNHPRASVSTYVTEVYLCVGGAIYPKYLLKSDQCIDYKAPRS